MRPLRTCLVASVVTLFAAPGVAQQPPAESVIQVIRQKPRPGMEQQYEAGRKKHMAWHKSQNDPWTWNVFEIITGPDTGSYLITTVGHQWADLDTWLAKYGAADTADSAAAMGSASAGAQVSYWTQLNTISRLPPADQRSPLLTLTVYRVKPGHDTSLLAAIGKLNKALEGAKYPIHSIWYRLASGGDVPSYAVVAPRANMAALGPVPSLMQAVEAQLGKPATDALVKEFFDNVTGATSELLQRRDDLGYMPD
jgi:hypothetical protein